MSEKDQRAVVAEIKAVWPGERIVPSRGLCRIPEVREGGLSDALIKLAAKIADQYYEEKQT